jgi:flavin-binding protein dodecin
MKIEPMSIVKVIEVIASSEKSIEDALQQAVAEASKTIRNIDSVYVKDIKAHVVNGKISSYGVICKMSFRLEEGKAEVPDETSEASAKEEPSREETAEKAPAAAGAQFVIQSKPGKETARGEAQSGTTSTASEETPEAAKKPDDSVKNEEKVSEPENQKDFIPAH